jgi:hypothetical protein
VAARGACIAADARYAAAFRKGLNETRYFCIASLCLALMVSSPK